MWDQKNWGCGHYYTQHEYFSDKVLLVIILYKILPCTVNRPTRRSTKIESRPYSYLLFKVLQVQKVYNTGCQNIMVW